MKKNKINKNKMNIKLKLKLLKNNLVEQVMA